MYSFLILALIAIQSCQTQTKKTNTVSHRGVHHKYGKYYNKRCRNYLNFRHNYVENTIDSIKKAFTLGAKTVEIDLLETKDKKIVLFHDENLYCKTGLDLELNTVTYIKLRNLNPAWGITFDNGKTFPLRKAKRYFIPSLEDVLLHFPNEPFLLNPKKDDYNFGVRIAKKIISHKPINLSNYMYWGPINTYNGLVKELGFKMVFLPNLRQSKKCKEQLRHKLHHTNLDECRKFKDFILDFKDLKKPKQFEMMYKNLKSLGINIHFFASDQIKLVDEELIKRFESIIYSNIDYISL